MSLKPKYKRIDAPDGKGIFTSLRWLKTGWDTLYINDQYFFIQFGYKPVKFLFIPFKNIEKTPRFLLGHHWETRKMTNYFMCGITHKPKDFRDFWRTQDNVSRSNRPEPGASIIYLQTQKESTLPD